MVTQDNRKYLLADKNNHNHVNPMLARDVRILLYELLIKIIEASVDCFSEGIEEVV